MFENKPFTNTYNIGLWADIIKRYENMEKYNMCFLEPQYVSDYPGVRAIFADKTWISNLISEKAFLELNGQHSMFIASQTGTGKTTFLMDKCLSRAIKSGMRILYLCNRSSLAMQVKHLALAHEENAELWIGKKQVKDLKKYYSDLGFSSLTNLGAIEVMTFQSFLHNYEDIDPKGYMGVFIDEAHYFVSDGTFNNFTEITLQKICEIFKNTRRIYLSATPQEVLDVIYEAENKYAGTLYSPPLIDVYCMKSDYGYMIPHFFADTADILSVINTRSNEKWLIFVKSKKTGEELKSDISSMGINVEFFTDETNKEDPLYLQLITKSILPVNCLISTKYLDCGVNIKDHMNLVIYDSDIVEIQQMIGRKRLTGPDEKVNVYFHIPKMSELKKAENGLRKRIAEINKRLYSLNHNEYIESIETPFFLVGNQIDYNSLCLKKLESEMQQCKRLVEFLGNFENITERNISYAKKLLEDFPQVSYCENDLLISNPKNELDKLFADVLGKTLSKNEFEIFSGEVVKLLGDPRTRVRETSPGINTINGVIKDYGCIFVASGDPTTYTLRREIL